MAGREARKTGWGKIRKSHCSLKKISKDLTLRITRKSHDFKNWRVTRWDCHLERLHRQKSQATLQGVGVEVGWSLFSMQGEQLRGYCSSHSR